MVGYYLSTLKHLHQTSGIHVFSLLIGIKCAEVVFLCFNIPLNYALYPIDATQPLHPIQLKRKDIDHLG